jgi:hypothetical protein
MNKGMYTLLFIGHTNFPYFARKNTKNAFAKKQLHPKKVINNPIC